MSYKPNTIDILCGVYCEYSNTRHMNIRRPVAGVCVRGSTGCLRCSVYLFRDVHFNHLSMCRSTGEDSVPNLRTHSAAAGSDMVRGKYFTHLFFKILI